MAKKPPGESAEDKAARLRERRLSELDRNVAAQRSSADMAGDLRAVYGLRGLPLAFGSSPAQSVPSTGADMMKQMMWNRVADRSSAAMADLWVGKIYQPPKNLGQKKP